MAKLTTYTQHDTLRKLAVTLAAGLITAIALNFFLTPAKVFQSGATGVAQLISLFLQQAGVAHQDLTGWFNLLLNLPLAYLAWHKLGRSFAIYSFITMFLVSALAIVLPVHALSTNPLMNAIFGGVLTGAGVGIALRFGFSTGGLDILSMYLAKTTRQTVGALMFIINLGIILVAGFGIQWESALYTIISIYCMTRVVDTIHTSNQKKSPQWWSRNTPTRDCRRAWPADSWHHRVAQPRRLPRARQHDADDRDHALRAVRFDAGHAGRRPRRFHRYLEHGRCLGEFLTSDQQEAKRAAQGQPHPTD